ncbi:Tetratricopeptide repeat-containing protein [Duganella sp. CF402]|uniref:response regulator n=1 Tax=unclassified Duganella TaxID=2636909 RepID=UPI0008C178E8|nr:MULTISPECIES: response regulator [unclassified Duganella]RZT10562.1 tetratricopeptide repeat protein [Duganella sp. BK701]SEL08166.1 Tetratricopeptide repeat-containing protein [Duganella sp. CF402]
MADYAALSVLLVDPSQSMRANLRNMLGQAGITSIDDAVSAGTAIRQINKKSYDVVLCEYDLGSGQDGQQLLEDLRLHKLIQPWTIFIMLTSEGVYSKVIGAAELTPTDYVLKPFTVDALLQRMRRAVERRDVFQRAYQMVELGNLQKAIAECVTGEEKNPRYATDFIRLRAELLTQQGELAQAEQAYQLILMTKPVAWAHLGLARSQFGLQKYVEAQATLQELLNQNSQYMAAYDLLARTHEALGQQEAAKKILEDAVAISPHMVHRLRHLGDVAYETGDVTAAEKAFKQVVAKAKYSEFRDPEDHVKLVKTLVRKGDANQASGVIRDMERSLRGGTNVDACRAIAAGMLQEMTGNITAAAAELTNAVNAVAGSRGLSTGLKIGLVHSCLNIKLDQQASDLMLNLMNDTESGVSMDDAVQVFEKAGRHDLAQGMGEQIKIQVDELIAHAEEQRTQGDLRAAVDTLNAGLRKAPGNLALLPAAASAMLKQLDDLGWEAPLAEQCQFLLDRMRRLDPNHPSLENLLAQYQHTQRKYGISVVA